MSSNKPLQLSAVLLLCVLAAVHTCPHPAVAQTLIHDYQFTSDFTDALGGPAIVGNGDVAGGVYDFDAGEGLSLSNWITANATSGNYSIAVQFTPDDITGFRRFFDFNDLANDSGIYSKENGYQFFDRTNDPGPTYDTTDTFATGKATNLLITRDGGTGLFTTYVDGVQLINQTYHDVNDAVFDATDNIIFLFQDNGAIEETGGTVDHVKVYDGALSPTQVAELITPDHQWNGATDSHWDNAANWDGGVPGANDTLLIPSGAPFSPIRASILELGTGGLGLAVQNDDLTVQADLRVGNGADGSGTWIINGGTLTVVDDLHAGSVFENGTGEIVINNGGTATATRIILGESSSVMTGQGVLTINNGGHAESTGNTWIGDDSPGIGTIHSGGSLTVGANLIISVTSPDSVLTINSGAMVTVGGDTNIGAMGELRLHGGILTTGSMTTNGTFDLDSGTFEITGAGGLTVGTAGPLSSSVVLDSGKTLNVTNTTTVESGATLTLDGGALTTDTVDNSAGGSFTFNNGTLGITGATGVTIGAGGLLGSSLSLNAGKTLEVSQTTTVEPAATLTVIGNAFSTDTLNLNGGEVTIQDLTSITTANFNSGTLGITGAGGLTIGAAGPLGATPSIGAGQTLNVTNTTTVESGATLTVDGGTFTSAGLSIAIGGTSELATQTTVTDQVVNNGTLTISGGTFTNTGTAVLLEGNGALNISGGTINGSIFGVQLASGAKGDISGGTISGVVNGVFVSGDVPLDITSGIIQGTGITGVGLRIGLNTTTVSGGTIQGTGDMGVGLRGGTGSFNPTTHISGGSISGTLIDISANGPDSTINLFGTNFSLPAGPIAAVSGSVSGTLLDTTAFDYDIERLNEGVINLVETNNQIFFSRNDGDWSDLATWNLLVKPTQTHHVLITGAQHPGAPALGPGTDVTVSTTEQANTLMVGNATDPFSLTIDGGDLSVAGATTIATGAIVTLNNGQLSTRGINGDGSFDFNNGTLSITGAAGLTVAPGVQLGANLTLDSGQTLNVTNTTVIEPTAMLTVNGGLFTSDTLRLNGGTFSAADLTGINNVDFISGNMAITGPGGFAIGSAAPFGSTLTLVNGKTLNVTGTTTVNADGALILAGGIWTTGEAINAGRLAVFSNPALNFGTGLTNTGELTLADTTVAGPVTSPAGSTITVLGTVTFNDLVSGAGGIFGPGTAVFNGGHNPGDSPAAVSVEGSLEYGSANTLSVELGGLTAGDDYDQVNVTGHAALDGTLDIQIIDNFDLDIVPFDAFTVMTWGTNTGDTEFDTIDFTPPGSIPGLSFDLIYDHITDDDLTLEATALGGDANLDGTVDLTDLTILAINFETPMETRRWRKADFNNDGLTNLTDLTILAINFGSSISGGAVLPGAGADVASLAAAVGLDLSGSAVPEPGALACVLALGPLACRRRGVGGTTRYRAGLMVI